MQVAKARLQQDTTSAGRSLTHTTVTLSARKDAMNRVWTNLQAT